MSGGRGERRQWARRLGDRKAADLQRFFRLLDWPLLAQQKQAVIELRATTTSQRVAERLSGIIHLIDALEALR